jgi:hypothetical protein
VYDAAGAAMMTFTPINRIHQHLCGFHVYACVYRCHGVVLFLDKLLDKTTPVMWRLIIFVVTARRIFIRCAFKLTRTLIFFIHRSSVCDLRLRHS